MTKIDIEAMEKKIKDILKDNHHTGQFELLRATKELLDLFLVSGYYYLKKGDFVRNGDEFHDGTFEGYKIINDIEDPQEFDYEDTCIIRRKL